MKKFVILALVIFSGWLLFGALLYDQPVSVEQPDGSKLNLLASGDEYYNYLHDANGYTVVQNPETGYYVYGTMSRGVLTASDNIVNEMNPASLGISPHLRISKEEYLQRRSRFDVPERYQSRAPTEGTLNNLVVYIRFADQSEFPEPRSEFDPLFNADDGETPSMYSYYQEVSYETLTISSSHYPISEMDTNMSYQSEYPRGYYSPYNYISNPEGYDGWEERAEREQTLLANAIEFIEPEVPDSLDIDGDEDGRVDNVCFIIRGGNDGWAELLWAHRWSLYMVDAYINGYLVRDFTFQPRTQVEVGTLNHEMFHALGAPDLYHYNSNVYAPAAAWDIMESGNGHMSAYMKYRYGNWIDELPLISEPGLYTLHPMSEGDENVYRIASNNPMEYFVLEYRKRVEGTYEMNLPGEGLLVWRVDGTLDGQGNADGPPDELYVYRPGGDYNSNGNPSGAPFNADYGRTEFNDETDPADWLQNGGYGGIFIHQVSSAGDSITFIYNPGEGFIAGTITSDQDDVDFTQGIVTIGDVEIMPGPEGGYSYVYYEGIYDVSAWLPGHGIETQTIEIITGDITMLDFDLSFLEAPYELTVNMEEAQMHLEWEFDDSSAETFEDFNVYVRLGENGNFQSIASTTENYYETTLSSAFDYAFYVIANYSNGDSEPSNIIEVVFSPINEDELILPEVDDFYSYPNPFNPETTIHFALAEAGKVRLSIYDIKGRLVNTLVNNILDEGAQAINWQGTDSQRRKVSSGVYFYRLERAGEPVRIKKLILMK
ncbi:MAG: M6 family metalloprotease domain-containing protein [Candidatus Stygibacter australis]|nr:M6 family metalloprotease domain-containing protein [Candidatus Stygibacter australis]MDP8321434.1 M6 family metalloprotease domain-containing protein [Candidatus Stygibacter australis]